MSRLLKSSSAASQSSLSTLARPAAGRVNRIRSSTLDPAPRRGAPIPPSFPFGVPADLAIIGRRLGHQYLLTVAGDLVFVLRLYLRAAEFLQIDSRSRFCAHHAV